MTETVTPTVRGWSKLGVAATLCVAAAVTGALAGLVAGLAGLVAGAARVPASWLAAVLVAAAVADGLAWRYGRPVPWSVRRQVPRVWSALFAPRTVAGLYGGRLGVGPLTHLPTWLWWAALVLAAAAGPGGGAVVLGAFGAVRGAAMVVASEWARPAMAARIAELRAREGVAAVAAVGLAVASGLLRL